jgi:uncharacterized protein (DUF924 family)
VTPEAIHAYWFANALDSPERARERLRFWFKSTPQEDREIAGRFASVLEAAARGACAHWETDPRSCLALVIVLDQFPRNIHRATPLAFAHDAQALETARRGVAAGHLAALHPIERAFLLMPLQHSEDLACQCESVARVEEIQRDAPPECQGVLAGFLHYARLHLELIERFGRFPHRNRILGRESTPEEIEFLRSNTESFGQGAGPES